MNEGSVESPVENLVWEGRDAGNAEEDCHRRTKTPGCSV